MKLGSLNGGTDNHRSRHQTSLATKTQCMLKKKCEQYLIKTVNWKSKLEKKQPKITHKYTPSLNISRKTPVHVKSTAQWNTFPECYLVSAASKSSCSALCDTFVARIYICPVARLVTLSTFSYCRFHLAVQHLLRTRESRLVQNHEPRISPRLAVRC